MHILVLDVLFNNGCTSNLHSLAIYLYIMYCVAYLHQAEVQKCSLSPSRLLFVASLLDLCESMCMQISLSLIPYPSIYVDAVNFALIFLCI